MDKALKQRLVGAVVLIALAVIVLPMIFGGKPSTGGADARSIELPAAPPDLEFETRRFPVGDEEGRGRSPAVPADSDARLETAEAGQVPALPEPKPSAGAQDEFEVADESGSGVDILNGQAVEPGEVGDVPPGDAMDTLVAGLLATDEADSDLRYVVQVASFGSAENAARLAGELEQAGYAVLLDHVSSDTGQLDRVRVGPYATEEEAQDTAAALSEDFSGVNPRIVDMRPDEAGPALAGEDPLMRWVVQVGSFSSEENAKQLVARLRDSGLAAYDETVRSDNSTIHRVRVGPYFDRSEALEAEQTISAGFGIAGVVMSAD